MRFCQAKMEFGTIPVSINIDWSQSHFVKIRAE